MSNPVEICLTCYGSGETATEGGLQSCPDCYGAGKALSRTTKLEWRLREIERVYHPSSREVHGKAEAQRDINWLVHELRRSREALVRILARCQDADETDALARDVKYQANEALGIYDPHARES
jgi:hypothetical protein